MRSVFRVKVPVAAPVFLACLLCVHSAWCQIPEPEVFSPLGKSFTAIPDETRSVETADRALTKGPASADLLLAAARARDAVLRFSESIPLYTRGMDDYPGDVRFPRFRGHRFISTRKFDLAISDLKRAAGIAPASLDVSYHLALAYYLRGDYNHAAREYQRCLAMAPQPKPRFMKGMPPDWRSCHSIDDDTLVAVTEWAWRSLRRAAKPEEAVKLLVAINPQMAVKENQSYFRTLLLYKGLHTESQTLAAPLEGNAAATVAYGVGLWHWVEGRKERACGAWEQVMTGSQWAAFGFIAAETELARGACKPVKKR
ncbi:MAG: tetratricopeptide repeat protein [Bryobacteraceae bacterium]